MEYNKTSEGEFVKMPIHNVDTGLGLERVLAIVNGNETVYDTELFVPIIDKIAEITGIPYQGADKDTVFAFRVIADHMRAATFILGDDKAVTPSNVDQGYVLRRILRRTMRYLRKLNAPSGSMAEISKIIVDNYSDIYTELDRNQEFIYSQLQKEETTFGRTLENGMKVARKELDKLSPGGVVDGETVFHLYDTFGFPLEFTQELAAEKSLTVDVEGFHLRFREHQEKSRLGAEKKFKGGLADTTAETARLHTATHLLNGALRKVLGDEVFQKGSNIIAERLRFDFSFGRKMTEEEIDRVTQLVNEAINLDIPVICEEMSVEDAKAAGAIGVFGDKYSERVKVYTISDYSKEICGGPHAERTGELKCFKILKESSSSAGVRRIKAVIDFE